MYNFERIKKLDNVVKERNSVLLLSQTIGNYFLINDE